MLVAYICEIILAIMILYYTIKSIISKDWVRIWSPLTIISLTYVYYCTIPFFFGVQEKYEFVENNYTSYLFHFAALLSYIFIHIGFSLKSRTQFKKWNCIYTNLNSGKIGLCLFFTALVFYVPFRGLHFSWTSTDEDQVLLNGGLIYYFISMIDMFSVSAALMLIGYKCNKKLLYYIIPLWIILSTFIFERYPYSSPFSNTLPG